ncbi:hypothetical protein Syun_000007 [Stephania yunnanensis]|uniref:Uncharacterized protein n=1 Tax=Stephania yunnanensis TaxID=152371 RepID=A0AAP0LCR6_9MAGN
MIPGLADSMEMLLLRNNQQAYASITSLLLHHHHQQQQQRLKRDHQNHLHFPLLAPDPPKTLPTTNPSNRINGSIQSIDRNSEMQFTTS